MIAGIKIETAYTAVMNAILLHYRAWERCRLVLIRYVLKKL